MERLSLDELEAGAGAYDRSVEASSDVDVFCSSSDWVVPAARGLMPGRPPWIWREGEAFLGLARADQGDRPWLEPLEAMWGLACPAVGADVPAVAHLLGGALAADGAGAALVLCGLAPGSARLRAVSYTHLTLPTILRV